MERELLCVWCERTVTEIVAEAALEGFDVPREEAVQVCLVSSHQVALCPDCRADREPLTEEEVDELLNAPIDLPPGITKLVHICPMMVYDNFSEEESTFEVALFREEGSDHYEGHCVECGMSVRSPVLEVKTPDEIQPAGE